MNDLLRVPELATRLGVTPSRVYQLIEQGLLPVTRIGGAICVPRTAWETWIAEQGYQALASLKERKEEECYANA